MEEIVNKVAQSGLVTIDLETYYPEGEIVVFDMKDHLFMEMLLKEKDFRAKLPLLDWEIYRDKNVAITCSTDAIIPAWAYMLVISYLEPIARYAAFSDAESLQRSLYLENLRAINVKEFEDKRVIIKGCGDKFITEAAYVEITRLLRPVAKSIMYGEACSSVPVYKKK